MILWFLPALSRLLPLNPIKNHTRILIIYDFASQPFSVGDILVMQEASLILKEQQKVDFVDIAIVYDFKDPVSSDKVFKAINSNNIFSGLASLIPVAQVNPNIGSLYCFNSHDQLEKYIRDNLNQYFIWPSGWDYAFTNEYLYYSIFDELIVPYWKENGHIPLLGCRPHLETWARDFYKKYTSKNIPVTVNIRNNINHHGKRNSDIDAWLAFFDYCASNYPVKFVVICSLDEIDDRLRSRSNVVVAKDFNTNAEQDLALIHESRIHLGTSSGPATMAWFSNKPYLIFNATIQDEYFADENLVVNLGDGFYKFCFANKNQKFCSNRETHRQLLIGFEEIYMEYVSANIL